MKKLNLRIDRLTELTSDDLAIAVGGGADTVTGNPLCILSIGDGYCVSNAPGCTALCATS
ncbi:MAG TPA: hypothetical protein VNQ77_11655 [Frankiaceae bacterium]|nr:hypothetical protein [Frankiaceae bacterium]